MMPRKIKVASWPVTFFARLFFVLSFLLVITPSSSAEEASNDFYLMLDSIGDDFSQSYADKYEYCEGTLIDWTIQAINNLYGERVANVSLFDPLMKSARTLGFMADAGGIISKIDYATVAANALIESKDWRDFFENYIRDTTALFIKKSISKGVAYVASNQLIKLGVNAEISEALNVEDVTEALLDIYASNKEVLDAARELWEESKDQFKNNEIISPVTYKNLAGCETKISALWDKSRSQVVITVNSECDCAQAEAAAAGKSWTPIKEGNATIVVNVDPAADAEDRVRWKGKIKSFKYGYECCDGTGYVSRGIYIEPSQEDINDDDYPDEEFEGTEQEEDVSKPKKSQGMSEKKRQYLERQRIGKLCETEFKTQMDRLDNEWRDKRNKLTKDYDKQIKELEEKHQLQKSAYESAMKQQVHVQSMIDAEDDPSLSYCEDMAKKQERISDDIRFQNERLVRGETRRGQCKSNCDYIEKEISGIKKEIKSLKQQRTELKSMEEDCKKGAKGLKDQLPALKDKKEFEQKRLDEIEKLLNKNKKDKESALESIDKQYKAAVAVLAAQLEDCKKSKDGKFLIPDGLDLTTKKPESYKLSEYKSKPKHSSGSGFLGEWQYGPYAIVEFKDEVGKLVGYWKKVGSIYGQQQYKAGDKLIEGGVENGVLTGVYNYKANIAKDMCPKEWDQWVSVKIKLKDNFMLEGALKNIGITWELAPNNRDVVACKALSNTSDFQMIRVQKNNSKHNAVESDPVATEIYNPQMQVQEPLEELEPFEP